MKVDTFRVGLLGCNCSLVGDRATGETVVVDPGGDFERIAAQRMAIGGRVIAVVDREERAATWYERSSSPFLR